MVSYWKQIGYRKKKITYPKYLIIKSEDPSNPRNNIYMFQSGFVPRVQRFLKKYNIDYDFESKVKLVEYDEPELKGIDLRY